MSEYRRKQAFEAGQKAFLAGKPETANNRQPGTIFYDDWGDGWNHERNKRPVAALSDHSADAGEVGR